MHLFVSYSSIYCNSSSSSSSTFFVVVKTCILILYKYQFDHHHDEARRPHLDIMASMEVRYPDGYMHRQRLDRNPVEYISIYYVVDFLYSKVFS